MSWFSSLLKKAAPVVSAVAPFIPGGQLVGAIATGITGLQAASDARKQRQSVTDPIQQQGQASLGLVNDYYRPLFEAILSGNRNNPDPYGLRTQALATNPYTSTLNAVRQASFGQGIDTQADSAINAFTEDLRDRGIAPSSSGAISRIGQIRSDQRRAAGDYARDLTTKGAEFNAQALRQADMDTLNRQMQLLSTLQGVNSQGLGALGGLQGLYASQEQQAGSGLTGAIGALADAGIFDRIFGRRDRAPDAGDGLLNTNQAGVSTKPRTAYDRILAGQRPFV